jgi:dephospho-CoA kinase
VVENHNNTSGSSATPIIGLSGGIGAGKSTVATEFERQGCRVIRSDALNHEVLRRREVLATLVSWWGPGVVSATGEPDRERIAAIVFDDPAERRRLESLTHPLIAEARAGIIAQAKSDPAVAAIILDSPLLFESNLDRSCDITVFIDVSEQERLQRLEEARNWDAAELQRREQWQLPVDEKRGRSDIVIDNEGSIEHLRQQVTNVLEKL